MGRRLVQHEHGRIGEQGARQHEPLALAAGELTAFLADERVEALRELLDPVEESALPQRLQELVVAPPGLGELRFSRIVAENRCASWPATAIARRTSSWR